MVTKFKREGRSNDETRPIIAKAGVIPNADGSAYFKIGKTAAYAAVYGPRNLHPKFKQDPEKGLLRCHYNMMPFSGTGNRVRPGQNRRAKEISMVTENALRPVLSFEDFPNSVVDVFIEIPEADAGTRAAGITAASIALADAGFAMKEMVAAVAVGKVNDTVIVDLDYNEEAWDGEVADIPVAMQPTTGEISLLQMDGKITPAQLDEAIGMVQDACKKINEYQKQALREKYEAIDASIPESEKVSHKEEPTEQAEEPAEEEPVEESEGDAPAEEAEDEDAEGDKQ
jgi:exosome complex component RRP41